MEDCRVTVAVVKVCADGLLEFAGAAMDATAQLFFAKQRVLALDQAERGAAGRSESADEIAGGTAASA